MSSSYQADLTFQFKNVKFSTSGVASGVTSVVNKKTTRFFFFFFSRNVSIAIVLFSLMENHVYLFFFFLKLFCKKFARCNSLNLFGDR